MSQLSVTVERDHTVASNVDAFSVRPHQSSTDLPLKTPSSGAEPDTTRPLRKRIAIVIAALTGVNFFSSLSSGLLTVGLPLIASDTALPEHLQLW